MPNLARAGGEDLAAFYQGVNASRTDDPHLTALGHSYGSLTTGYALQHDGTGVDDAVLFGSPGPAPGSATTCTCPSTISSWPRPTTTPWQTSAARPPSASTPAT